MLELQPDSCGHPKLYPHVDSSLHSDAFFRSPAQDGTPKKKGPQKGPQVRIQPMHPKLDEP